MTLQVKKNIGLILLSAFLWWAAATHGRDSFIQFRCSPSTPECLKSSINFVDGFSVDFENPTADHYSFLSQNTAGVLAILIPLFFCAFLVVRAKMKLGAGLKMLLSEWSIILQTIAINGIFTEISHFISQRPRPFVFKNPILLGNDPAHFTSFYSGHTSFTATCTTAVLMMLLHRGAPLWLSFSWAIIGQGLILSTAYFRILAGRHFPTDVLCGALAGIAVGFCVAYFYRFKSAKKLND